MPVEVVDLDLTASTGAAPKPTYTDVGLIGTASSSPSGAEFGELNRYSSSDDVADEYGDGSDVHTASEAVEQMGASYWYVIVLEEVEHTETLNDGDTISNLPVLGDPDVTASVGDIEASTAIPPSTPTEGSLYNPASGAFASAESDVDVTYKTADFGALQPLQYDANRIGMADRKMSKAHIGVLDELVSFASGQDMGAVAGGINGNTAADDDAALSEYHDVFGYVPSGDLIAIAHKSSDAVEGYVLGQLATNDPWFDPFYDGDGYPFATGYYERGLVGDPGTPGTFEGGDSQSQTGNVNVVISKNGVQVLSNSLSTAGAASNYAFYDVARTQDFLAAEVRRNLTSLRLRQDQIPFTSKGRAQIQNVISNTLSQYVGGGGPLASFTVTIPPIAQLTQSQKANRNYAGIKIEATLAGNVHTFSVELNITV